MLNIIKKLFTTHSYSVELAKKIGLEKSAFISWAIQRHSDNVFFHQSIPYYLIPNNKFIQQLIADGFIIHESDSYKINILKILELFENDNKKGALPETVPTFRDNNFIGLCSRWHTVLKSKNRRKTLKEIYDLFADKTLEDSITALEVAVNNQYVSLQFNHEVTKRAVENTSSRGGIGFTSGGSTNTGGTDEFKKEPLRPPESV